MAKCNEEASLATCKGLAGIKTGGYVFQIQCLQQFRSGDMLPAKVVVMLQGDLQHNTRV